MNAIHVTNASRWPLYRAVVSGGAEGALDPPEFGTSVNPILTRGGRLCPRLCTASIPGFENLTTTLLYEMKIITPFYLTHEVKVSKF